MQVKPASPQPMLDLAPVCPECDELGARDESVLARREVGNRSIQAQRVTFAITVMANVTRVRHAGSFPRRV